LLMHKPRKGGSIYVVSAEYGRKKMAKEGGGGLRIKISGLQCKMLLRGGVESRLWGRIWMEVEGKTGYSKYTRLKQPLRKTVKYHLTYEHAPNAGTLRNLLGAYRKNKLQEEKGIKTLLKKGNRIKKPQRTKTRDRDHGEDTVLRWRVGTIPSQNRKNTGGSELERTSGQRKGGGGKSTVEL